MRHKKLLSPENSILMVVDIQEAFQNSIPDLEKVVQRGLILIQAAKLLELPIIVTEQYPKGLGQTLKPLREVLGESPYYDKITFSCLQDDKIKQAILAQQRNQLLLVGIEAHICIMQTAYDALSLGLQPYLITDAVSSRKTYDMDMALERTRDAGAILTTAEAAIMEMTASSKHPAFKEISRLIKQPSPIS